MWVLKVVAHAGHHRCLEQGPSWVSFSTARAAAYWGGPYTKAPAITIQTKLSACIQHNPRVMTRDTVHKHQVNARVHLQAVPASLRHVCIMAVA